MSAIDRETVSAAPESRDEGLEEATMLHDPRKYLELVTSNRTMQQRKDIARKLRIVADTTTGESFAIAEARLEQYQFASRI